MNGLMAMIAVFIGGLLALESIGFSAILHPNFYLGVIAVFLITGAGNVINDYADTESDKINRPSRPIPSGRVSKRSALVFSLVLFVLGIFLVFFMKNLVVFTIALVNSAFLIIYSFYLQNKILLGNIVIGYLVGSTFFFGGAIFGNPLLPLILMVLSALVIFSREVVKDLEDIEGDRKGFLKRLTSGIKSKLSRRSGIAERFGITTRGVTFTYGKRRATVTAALGLVLAVVVSPLPYLWEMLGSSYLALVILTDIVFIFSIYKLTKTNGKRQYARISRNIKIGMFLGLLAFIAGILV